MAESSPRGTYLEIAASLRTAIEAEPPLADLPSEAVLSAQFAVARTTVRRALKLLQADGLVEPAPGVGWQLVKSGQDRRPLAEQLADLVRVQQVGDTFLTEKELATRFKRSRNTVRGALALLEGRGVLESQPGKGRVIRAIPAPDLNY